MCFLIDCLIKDGFTDISFVMKSYSLIKIGFDIRCTSHHVTLRTLLCRTAPLYLLSIVYQIQQKYQNFDVLLLICTKLITIV